VRQKFLGALLVFLLLLSMSCSRAIDENTIVLFTWNDYIDPQILKDFTAETGIRVHMENYSTNEDMLAKLELNPGYFDLVTPGDFMIDYLIQNNQLAELDFNNIPNARHLMPTLRNPVYDPQGKYALPYAWGTVGIIYDTTKVDAPVDSFGVLWDEKYSGSIIMPDSIRETIGTALIYLGHPVDTTNPAHLREAGELLKRQEPLVMGYIGDATKTLMSAGEATLAVTWGGDAVVALRENPNMTYVVPNEGAILFVESFIIPKDSKKKELAEAFIDYMYRPEVGYQSWEYIGYSTPNQGTFELLPLEEQRDTRWYPALPNPLLQQLRDMDNQTLELYNQIWLSLKV
jgi:spermidine/putrescine-binding protein